MAAALAVTLVTGLFAPFGPAPGARAAVNDTCPAGSSTPPPDTPCPDLSNQYLGPQRAFPRDLYRADTRLPEVIFRDGFAARGTNYDLPSHVRGTLPDSGWISTTGALSVAEDQFVRSAGQAGLVDAVSRGFCANGGSWAAVVPGLGNIVMGSCQGQLVSARSFVYLVDPTVARNAVYVPDQLGPTADPNLRRFFQQDEWAYAHRIPPEAVVGVRIYLFTARRSGTTFDAATMTMQYENFVPNDRYLHRDPQAPRYLPNLDQAAAFTLTTWLNVLFWHYDPRRTLGPTDPSATSVPVTPSDSGAASPTSVPASSAPVSSVPVPAGTTGPPAGTASP